MAFLIILGQVAVFPAISTTVIRHDQSHQPDDAARAHQWLSIPIDADPRGALVLGLARKLGRIRALAVMIDPDVIELACR